jgi:F-type H+-transporting ATPase subunit b
MDINIIPDLPQLITHAVGFLIFFFVMKKFAWGPLLALLEERRNKIAGEFQKIEDDKVNVAKLTTQYEGKLKDIDAERRAKLVEAVDEGKKISEEIKASAREDAKQIGSKAKEELDRDVAKAKVQLKNDMITMTIAAAEKLIDEKLDDDRHRRLIGDFIDNLEKA